MPQNDPGFWEAATGYAVAAFGAVSLWAWKHTHGLLRNKAEKDKVQSIENAVTEKADAAAVVLLAATVKEKADAVLVNGIMDRLEKVLENQRDDSERIFKSIEKVADTHAKFAEMCIGELGKRPTREECQVIWHRQAG